jgi:hypothetical protein
MSGYEKEKKRKEKKRKKERKKERLKTGIYPASPFILPTASSSSDSLGIQCCHFPGSGFKTYVDT